MKPDLPPSPAVLAHRLALSGGRLHWLELRLSADGNALQPCVGRPAGGVIGGHLVVTLDGARLRAARVAWALHYGEWPAHDVHLLDRDPYNLTRDNLAAGAQPRKQRTDPFAAAVLSDVDAAAHWEMVEKLAQPALDDEPLG